jgi:hypothetical protein
MGGDWVSEGAATDRRPTTPLLPAPEICGSAQGAFRVSPAPGAFGFRRLAGRLSSPCAAPRRESYPGRGELTRPPVRIGGPVGPAEPLLPTGVGVAEGGELLPGGRDAVADGSGTAVVGSLAVIGADNVGTDRDVVTGSELLAVGRGSFAATAAAAVVVGAVGVGKATGWAWAGLASGGTSAVVAAAAAAATASKTRRAGRLLFSVRLVPTVFSGRCARGSLTGCRGERRWEVSTLRRLAISSP